MKKILFLLAIAFCLNFSFAMAQGKKIGNQTVEIKSSVQCEMCEERVTKALTSQKGVKSVKVNLESKVIAVTYNSHQIETSKIRETIAKVGYDADDKKADTAAYKKLPACCKKG